LCSFFQPPVSSSLFGSNILLRTLFSNTLSQVFILVLVIPSTTPYLLYSLAILFQTISFWTLAPFTLSSEQKKSAFVGPLNTVTVPDSWAILPRDPKETHFVYSSDGINPFYIFNDLFVVKRSQFYSVKYMYKNSPKLFMY
jgi:hypothetical protein